MKKLINIRNASGGLSINDKPERRSGEGAKKRNDLQRLKYISRSKSWSVI